MITAYFLYDEGEACLEFARWLTSLFETHPHTTFRFCTHEDENAIGVLVCEDPADLTPDAMAHAWEQQAQNWIHDEDPDFDLSAWIHGWALLPSN